MSWSKTEADEWRAPFDAHEQLHATIPGASLPIGREHWSITAAVKLDVRGIADVEAALRNAWVALRFEHPAIAAHHDVERREKVYRSPRPGTTDIQEWVQQTFVVISETTSALPTPTHDPKAKTADDLLANFKPHALPTLYFLSSTSELVYHTSHWRSDGFGVLMLVSRLCELCCSPPDLSSLPWGEEVVRLHPSVETLLDVPAQVTPAGQDLVNARVMQFVSAMPSTGLASRGTADTLPHGTRRTSLTFSAASTAALVSACKAAGLPVSVAVNAASVRATFAHEASHSHGHGYASAVPTDLRHLLRAPYNGPAYASTFGMTGHAITVPRGQSFAEAAQTLAAQYRDDMVTPAFIGAARAWAAAFQALVTTPPPPGPPASEIGNSSLGVVERHLAGAYSSADGARTLTVTAFWLAVEMMTHQLELHVWTWRGQLCLSATFNEAFHDPSGVQAVLETVRRELEQGLGVALQPAAAST